MAADAQRTGSALAAFNRLPGDFPIEAMTEMCRALLHLKDGTGRNAGTQLEIARAWLPRIRREHFYPEELTNPKDEYDLRLIRGMSLDQGLGTLIAQVATALDEYRHQLQTDHDDQVRAEDETCLPPGESVAALDTSSAAIIAEVEAMDRDFASHGLGETANGDILRRRVWDGANLVGTARATAPAPNRQPVAQGHYRSAAQAARADPGRR